MSRAVKPLKPSRHRENQRKRRLLNGGVAHYDASAEFMTSMKSFHPPWPSEEGSSVAITGRLVSLAVQRRVCGVVLALKPCPNWKIPFKRHCSPATVRNPAPWSSLVPPAISPIASSFPPSTTSPPQATCRPSSRSWVLHGVTRQTKASGRNWRRGTARTAVRATMTSCGRASPSAFTITAASLKTSKATRPWAACWTSLMRNAALLQTASSTSPQLQRLSNPSWK